MHFLPSINILSEEWVQTKITIRVEEVTFDAAQCSLRVNGVNIKENEHIKIGTFSVVEIISLPSF